MNPEKHTTPTMAARCFSCPGRFPFNDYKGIGAGYAGCYGSLGAKLVAEYTARNEGWNSSGWRRICAMKAGYVFDFAEF